MNSSSAATQPRLACPRCSSSRTVPGHVASEGPGRFQPSELTLRLNISIPNVPVAATHFRGCLGCGLVWNEVPVPALLAVLQSHGTDEVRSLLSAPA